MAKHKKMYAVHFKDGRKEPNVIFYSWDEEQKATFKVPHMMHGFETEEEAQNWFCSITTEREKEHSEYVARQKEVRRTKKDKVEYVFKLDKKLSEKFQEKLRLMHKDVETVITDFVLEYLGEE